MVNINAFILAVQNLTGEGTAKELAQLCRKWIDENGEKISAAEADRLLHMVNVQTHTLGAICALRIKLLKIKTDAELCEFLTNLHALLLQFDARQIHWAPDLYDHFFESITDQLLRKGAPLWGILLLERAILVASFGHSDRLSNLHCSLFCLCLKARHFDLAAPFLRVDVVELFKRSSDGGGGGTAGADSASALGGGALVSSDNDKVSSSENQQAHAGGSSSSGNVSGSSSIASSAVSFFHKVITMSGGSSSIKMDEPKQIQPFLKRRSVLLYFYYGAMIYAALEQWEQAALFLEHLICLPMLKKNSAIVLEALKKYNIIWLILGRRKPLDSLPHYRSASIQRNFVSMASVYVKLWPMVQRNAENKSDVVRALNCYLEEKRTIFARDKNVGLMKVLIKVCRENSIKRLGNIFVSLHLTDVARMAHLPAAANNNAAEDQSAATDDVSAEHIIMRLRQNNQLIARIDGRTQTVVFEEEAKGSKLDMAQKAQQDVDAAMADVVGLARIARAYEDAVRLNPAYIERSTQSEKARALIAGGNGSGGGYGLLSLCPEDEGLFFTGSP